MAEKLHVKNAEEFHKMPQEYQDLVIKQMLVHTEGELSGADDYVELFYPMTDDAYEKKVCCERAAEEVDHFRKGAKVLNDIGVDTDFIVNTPLQERNLYATEAVKKIDNWAQRGLFSFLGEAAVLAILYEMAESSYQPIVDMCPTIIKEEIVHVANGHRIVKNLCKTEEGKAEIQKELKRWWPVTLDLFGKSNSKRSQQYVQWGLRKYTNEEARERFIQETFPKVENLGLTIPENHENRQFL